MWTAQVGHYWIDRQDKNYWHTISGWSPHSWSRTSSHYRYHHSCTRCNLHKPCKLASIGRCVDHWPKLGLYPCYSCQVQEGRFQLVHWSKPKKKNLLLRKRYMTVQGTLFPIDNTSSLVISTYIFMKCKRSKMELSSLLELSKSAEGRNVTFSHLVPCERLLCIGTAPFNWWASTHSMKA